MTQGAWLFADSPDTEAYATTRVLDGSRPLRYVMHDEDGDWQSLCGTTGARRNVRLVRLRALVEQFPHAVALAGLPRGSTAEWLPDEHTWEAGPSHV